MECPRAPPRRAAPFTFVITILSKCEPDLFTPHSHPHTLFLFSSGRQFISVTPACVPPEVPFLSVAIPSVGLRYPAPSPRTYCERVVEGTPLPRLQGQRDQREMSLHGALLPVWIIPPLRNPHLFAGRCVSSESANPRTLAGNLILKICFKEQYY